MFMGFLQFMSPDEIVIFIGFLKHHFKGKQNSLKSVGLQMKMYLFHCFWCLTCCLLVQKHTFIGQKKKKKKEIRLT